MTLIYYFRVNMFLKMQIENCKKQKTKVLLGKET